MSSTRTYSDGQVARFCKRGAASRVAAAVPLGLSSIQIRTETVCVGKGVNKQSGPECGVRVEDVSAGTRGMISRDRDLDVSEAAFRDKHAQVEMYPEGSLLRVAGLKGWEWIKPEQYRKARKPCRTYSWRSRNALLDLLGMLDRNARPLFLTLTIPESLDLGPHEAKELLKVWAQKETRRSPKLCMVWKMEPQKNGMPHFHLFAWGIERWNWQRLAVSWAETVAGCVAPKMPNFTLGESGAERFREWLQEIEYTGEVSQLFCDVASAGTRVEEIRSENGVKCYAAKYLGKEIEEQHGAKWAKPGRFWGVFKRENLPRARRVVVVVGREVGVKVSRVVRRYLNAQDQRKREHARKVNVKDWDEWARVLVWAEGCKPGTFPVRNCPWPHTGEPWRFAVRP